MRPLAIPPRPFFGGPCVAGPLGPDDLTARLYAASRRHMALRPMPPHEERLYRLGHALRVRLVPERDR